MAAIQRGGESRHSTKPPSTGSSRTVAAGRSGHRLRAAVIFNPTAGWARGGWRRNRFRAYLEAMEAAGIEVSLRETLCAGDGVRLARAAAAEAAGALPLDMVIAAGGDGTVNEAVNGLVAPAGRAGTNSLPLGLLPLGTANVLAHEVALPFAPAALARGLAGVHATGAVRSLHLGLANGRYFILMAGVGLDAHVVERVDLDLKRRLGKMAYALATLATAPGFAWPRYRVSLLEGAAAEGREPPVFEAAQVIAAKARFYGGRNLLAPEAAPWRPDFQVCLFSRGGLLPAAVCGTRLFIGRLAGARGFRIEAARRLLIEGPSGEPVQADGDVIARLPTEIALRRDAVRLIVPPSPVPQA